MIPYSLSKRAVDPSKQDGEMRYYPYAQSTNVMELSEFARHIAAHGSKYQRADIVAVSLMIVDCLREMLLNGNKVKLGDLGNFYVTLSSKGKPTVEEFVATTDITSVNVVWEPGLEFTNLLKDAVFQNVATKRAQAATLKAERAGETQVDISKPTKDDSGSSETPPTEEGDGGGSLI